MERLNNRFVISILIGIICISILIVAPRIVAESLVSNSTEAVPPKLVSSEPSGNQQVSHLTKVENRLRASPVLDKPSVEPQAKTHFPDGKKTASSSSIDGQKALFGRTNQWSATDSPQLEVESKSGDSERRSNPDAVHVEIPSAFPNKVVATDTTALQNGIEQPRIRLIPDSVSSAIEESHGVALKSILTAASEATTEHSQSEPPGLANPHEIESTEQRSDNIYVNQINLPASISAATIASVRQKISYANSLARRGAISTAELELQSALRTISESLDRKSGSNEFTQELANAFTAFQEAEDFGNDVTDIAIFVAGHETPILQSHITSNISPKNAIMAYYQYGESLIEKACGGQQIAAEALRSLGKLYSIADRFGQTSDNSIAKAMVMYQIASRVNPGDAQSSAELGVLYAKFNHLIEAKQLLINSLHAQPDSKTWQSLASVHQALGERHLAQQADQESRLMKQASGSRLVKWSNPAAFNDINAMVDPPVMTASNVPKVQSPTSKTKQSGNGVGYFKWR